MKASGEHTHTYTLTHTLIITCVSATHNIYSDEQVTSKVIPKCRQQDHSFPSKLITVRQYTHSTIAVSSIEDETSMLSVVIRMMQSELMIHLGVYLVLSIYDLKSEVKVHLGI